MTENEIQRTGEVLWTKWFNTSDSREDRELHITLNYAMKIIKEYRKYRAIGTIEEFKALKENERKCEDCAGCTTWKCDCANERAYALNEFANYLHEKAKENNGLRLSSETRSWTHPCIFDYLEEFNAEQTCKEEH